MSGPETLIPSFFLFVPYPFVVRPFGSNSGSFFRHLRATRGLWQMDCGADYCKLYGRTLLF
jgi:hypothetical protein